MQKARKVVSGAMSAMVVVVLLTFIAWFTVPRVMGWTPLRVLSGSMEPTLPLGSVAFVEPKSPNQVEVGDILTFKHPDKPAVMVTHRVVSIDQVSGTPIRMFKTKGDANSIDDAWIVLPQHIIGTVKFDVPYAGRLTDTVQSPFGFLLIVGLPAMYIGAGEVTSIVRELRNLRRPPASPGTEPTP